MDNIGLVTGTIFRSTNFLQNAGVLSQMAAIQRAVPRVPVTPMFPPHMLEQLRMIREAMQPARLSGLPNQAWLDGENARNAALRSLATTLPLAKGLDVYAGLAPVFELLKPLHEATMNLRPLLDILERLDPERFIDLNEDEEVTEETFRGLHVPKGENLITLGTFQFAFMARLLREPLAMEFLHHRQLEYLVAELLCDQGFEDVNLTKGSGDGGKDIVASRRVDGRLSLVFVEVKHYKRQDVGLEEVLKLYGAISHNTKKTKKPTSGIIVTSGERLTSGGLRFIAESADEMDAKVRKDLVAWLEHYRKRHSS